MVILLFPNTPLLNCGLAITMSYIHIRRNKVNLLLNSIPVDVLFTHKIVYAVVLTHLRVSILAPYPTCACVCTYKLVHASGTIHE